MPSVSSSVVFAFIVSLSVLPTILADARCYYPPLEEKLVYQPLDTPCNPNAQESNCCAPDDICLSNGLCWRANINRLHRGVCCPPWPLARSYGNVFSNFLRRSFHSQYASKGKKPPSLISPQTELHRPNFRQPLLHPVLHCPRHS